MTALDPALYLLFGPGGPTARPTALDPALLLLLGPTPSPPAATVADPALLLLLGPPPPRPTPTALDPGLLLLLGPPGVLASPTPTALDPALLLLLGPPGVLAAPTPTVVDPATWLVLTGSDPASRTVVGPPPPTLPAGFILFWLNAPEPDPALPLPTLTASPGTAAPACVPFLFDDFAGAPGALEGRTAPTGGAWSASPAYPGSVLLDGGGGVYAASAGLVVDFNAAAPPNANYADAEPGGYRVEADLQVYTAAGRAGLVVCADAITAQHYFGYYDADLARWGIARDGQDIATVAVADLTAANPGAAAALAPQSGATYRIQFYNNGGRIVLLVNDIVLLTVDDRTVNQVGRAGIGFTGAATATTGLHLAELHACSLMLVPTNLGTLAASLARMPVDGGAVRAAQPIVAGTTLTQTCVAVVIDPMPFPARQGPTVLLQLRPRPPRAAQVDGAGRSLSGMTGRFAFHVLDQSRRDQMGQDTIRLLAETLDPLTGLPLGLARIAHRLIDLLQVTLPTDRWGNTIVQAPLRVAADPDPRTYAPAGAQGVADWSGFAIEFEADYTLDLTAGKPLT